MAEDFSQGDPNHFAADIPAERHLLGTLLVEQSTFETARAIVSDRDFSQEEHRHVFEAITALVERGETVDLLTVQEELMRWGGDEQIGGIRFLTSLLEALPPAGNVAEYARIVRLCALWRGQSPPAS